MQRVKSMPTAIRNACGLALIAAGLLAMPIPVIPGIPLIAAGVLMLGANHPIARASRACLQKLNLWRRPS